MFLFVVLFSIAARTSKPPFGPPMTLYFHVLRRWQLSESEGEPPLSFGSWFMDSKSKWLGVPFQNISCGHHLLCSRAGEDISDKQLSTCVAN